MPLSYFLNLFVGGARETVTGISDSFGCYTFIGVHTAVSYNSSKDLQFSLPSRLITYQTLPLPALGTQGM